MKSNTKPGYVTAQTVTPRAGVWVEICITSVIIEQDKVTPRAGVWVEIVLSAGMQTASMVTPRAGVWVEIR